MRPLLSKCALEASMNIRLSILISYATIALVIFGCSSIPPTPPTLDSQLRLQQSARVTELIQRAKECEVPAVATVKLSSSFRYGCFCGKGYPKFETLPPHASNANSQEALIEQYLSIKPIDSIDEACRDHDICWVMRGEEDGRCNEELIQRLDYIHDFMFYEVVVDSTEWRCSNLALDMQGAFLTLFVGGKYESGGAGHKLGKIIGTPILAIGALLSLPSWVGKSPYPKCGERCIVPNFSFSTNGKETRLPNSP